MIVVVRESWSSGSGRLRTGVNAIVRAADAMGAGFLPDIRAQW